MDRLTDEQLGKFLRLYYQMQLTGDTDIETGDPMLDMLLDQVREQTAYDIGAYNRKCEVNKENGDKGGRPPKKTQTVISENRKKPTGVEIDTDNEIEIEPEIDSESSKEDGNAFLLADGSAFRLPPSRIAEFKKTFPEVNVDAELMRCRLKHNALSQKRNSLTIEQYIVRWLINAQADAKKARPSFTDMQKREEKLDDSFMRELAAKPGNLI